MDQQTFAHGGTASGCGFREGRRFLPLRRRFIFKRQYTR